MLLGVSAERVIDIASGAKRRTEKQGPTNVPGTKAAPAIKKGLTIDFETRDGKWHEGEVVRRTGKSTGKYKDHWEILEKETGMVNEYDTVKDWNQWREQVSSDDDYLSGNEVFLIEKSVESEKEKKVVEAKKLELAKWIDEEVYEIVADSGQELLSTTWVITEKMIDNEVVTKAR